MLFWFDIGAFPRSAGQGLQCGDAAISAGSSRAATDHGHARWTGTQRENWLEVVELRTCVFVWFFFEIIYINLQ